MSIWKAVGCLKSGNRTDRQVRKQTERGKEKKENKDKHKRETEHKRQILTKLHVQIILA